MEENLDSYDLCDLSDHSEGANSVLVSGTGSKISKPMNFQMYQSTKRNKQEEFENVDFDLGSARQRYTTITPPSLAKKNKSSGSFLFQADDESLEKLRKTQKNVIKKKGVIKRVLSKVTSGKDDIKDEELISLSSKDTEKSQIKLLQKFIRQGMASQRDKEEFVILILRNKGLAPNIRKKLWMILAEVGKNMKTSPNYYYFPKGYSYEEGSRIHGSHSGLEQSTNRHRLLYSYPHMPDIYEKQILLDLERTFCDEPEFCTKNDKNKRILLNILLSYTKRNSTIGYCQGMNYLAATLFRVFEDEELAFWGLCNLCESVLPLDYYSHMVEVLVDQKVFVHLLQEKKPELYAHLQNLGLDVALVLFQWFICLFGSQFNREVTEAIWDLILLEKSVAVFKSSLAIFDIMEEEILNSSDFSDIYPLLNEKPFEIVNQASVIMKSLKKFVDINSSQIEKLRDNYRPIILEEQQKSYNSTKSVSKILKEPISTRRIKLLSKFPLLDFYLRESLEEKLTRMDKVDLVVKDYECQDQPICLYDFTFRAKSCNFLVYRVGCPVAVYDDYFGGEEVTSGGPKMPNSFIFTSEASQRAHKDDSYEKITSSLNTKANPPPNLTKYSDSDLLICRETHLCTNSNFSEEFQNLFNTNCPSLFTPQLHTLIFDFNGDEKASELAKVEILKILKDDVQKIQEDHTGNRKRGKAVVERELEEEKGGDKEGFDIEAFIQEIEEGWSMPDEDISKYIKRKQIISSDSEKSPIHRASEFDFMAVLKNKDNMRGTLMLMSTMFKETDKSSNCGESHI
ncbi:unnamed protein product [Moneuplotes crassus]|uniref:Rab-GAP TBC domain-containing protein n=2 Tax=Euplotes crassus TaxID=5936 RepID=A0AAD1XZW4_EUPCR|nr:unnamed protein product [Moneuplotes crassus]